MVSRTLYLTFIAASSRASSFALSLTSSMSPRPEGTPKVPLLLTESSLPCTFLRNNGTDEREYFFCYVAGCTVTGFNGKAERYIARSLPPEIGKPDSIYVFHRNAPPMPAEILKILRQFSIYHTIIVLFSFTCYNKQPVLSVTDRTGHFCFHTAYSNLARNS